MIITWIVDIRCCSYLVGKHVKHVIGRILSSIKIMECFRFRAYWCRPLVTVWAVLYIGTDVFPLITWWINEWPNELNASIFSDSYTLLSETCLNQWFQCFNVFYRIYCLSLWTLRWSLFTYERNTVKRASDSVRESVFSNRWPSASEGKFWLRKGLTFTFGNYIAFTTLTYVSSSSTLLLVISRNESQP